MVNYQVLSKCKERIKTLIVGFYDSYKILQKEMKPY